jgi:hypothetical protein
MSPQTAAYALLALCAIAAFLTLAYWSRRKPSVRGAVSVSGVGQQAADFLRTNGIEHVRRNIDELRREVGEDCKLDIKAITEALDEAERLIQSGRFDEALALIRQANWPIVLQIQEVRHEKAQHPSAKFTEMKISFGDHHSND